MLGPESETAWRKAGSQFKLGRWRSLTVRDTEKQVHVYIALTYREKTEGTIKWWKGTEARSQDLPRNQAPSSPSWPWNSNSIHPIHSSISRRPVTFQVESMLSISINFSQSWNSTKTINKEALKKKKTNPPHTRRGGKTNSNEIPEAGKWVVGRKMEEEDIMLNKKWITHRVNSIHSPKSPQHSNWWHQAPQEGST